jgi:hypothetical protein
MAMGNSPCSSMTFPAKHVPHLRLIPRPHRQRPHLGSNATFENNRLGSSPTFGVPSPPPFVHGLVLRKFEKHDFYPENPWHLGLSCRRSHSPIPAWAPLPLHRQHHRAVGQGCIKLLFSHPKNGQKNGSNVPPSIGSWRSPIDMITSLFLSPEIKETLRRLSLTRLGRLYWTESACTWDGFSGIAPWVFGGL